MSDQDPKPPPAEESDEARAKAEAAAKAKAAAKAAREAAEAAKPAWERDPVSPRWESADGDPEVAALREKHGEAIRTARTFAGELILEIERDAIRQVAASVKDELGYRLMVDICGVDYPDREAGRFEIVYHVYSLGQNRRLGLRVSTDEATPVPSVASVWAGANWPEREVFDMYGVRFADHPDMTRILTWEGFTGHPLRKDFPVEGIDTGAAIYPESYESSAGPLSGTDGTGYKIAAPATEAEAEEGGPETGDAKA